MRSPQLSRRSVRRPNRDAQVATTDLAVAHVAGLEAAVNAEDAVQKLPGFAAVTVPAFISSMLAVPVATLALWRARLARSR